MEKKAKPSSAGKPGARPRKARPKNPDALIAEKFPHLSQQQGKDLEDLQLTDREFGAKYKRGKRQRLIDLENLENRLLIGAMQARLEQLQRLVSRLEQLLSDDQMLIARCLAPPTSLAQGSAVLQLSFIRVGGDGLEFQLDPMSMSDQLARVAPDEVSIDVLRNLIVDVTRSATVHDIAERHGLGRQAIYDRQTRLVAKLDQICSSPDFVVLAEYLRRNACVIRGTRLVCYTGHPLVAMLLLPAGQFPSVHDVIAVGLWAVARKEVGGKRSFTTLATGVSPTEELVAEPN